MTVSSSKSEMRPRRTAVWAVLLGALLGALLSLVLGDWERRELFDTWQRVAPRKISSDRVAVVLIDSRSLEIVSAWPWPRYYVARLIEEIAKQRPKAIGTELIFPEHDPLDPRAFVDLNPELAPNVATQVRKLPGMDAVLATVLAGAPIVLARLGVEQNGADPNSFITDPRIAGTPPPDVLRFRQVLASLPEFDDVALGHGMINGPPDEDGIVRSVPLTIMAGEQANPGYAIELARIGADVSDLAWNGRNLRFGKTALPADNAGRLAFRMGQFPERAVYSAAEVLGDKIRPDAFTGKVVLVGLGAEGTSDIVATPLATENFGLLVQAQAIDAILGRGWLARPAWASWAEWAAALALALLTALASSTRRHLLLGLAGVLAVALWAGSFIAYDRTNFLFDPVRPTLVGFSAVLSMWIMQFAEARAERRMIHSAFDRYLSPELVKRIIRDPSQLKLGGEEREMTVLFCDVRGFSALSESLTPQQTIQFLIGLLTPMTDVLLDNKSTIDKYMGDAIVAFWNAPLDDPDHACNAADAALAMIAKLEILNRERPAEGLYPWPSQVRLGIGLASGPVCVGNMGSEQRLSYSIIGDTVNLASRIEGLTKQYGISVALDGSMASSIRDYAIIEIDLVRVVGRSRPEPLFALLGGTSYAASPDFVAFKQQFEEMRATYLRREWDKTESLLDRFSGMAVARGLEKLVETYRNRISMFRLNPPAVDWDGVHLALEK